MKSKVNFLESLSVVIPTYNAADWLPKTIYHVLDALEAASFEESNAEIIIVNDGSSDSTVKTVGALKSKYPIRIVTQSNSGRFVARKKGIETASHNTILLIDSRVHIYKNSVKFVKDYVAGGSPLLLWNAHVDVEKKGNIFARFGEAIVFIGWRKYFSNPRIVSYKIEDFDYYPKGTTCFIAPKSLLSEAIVWFESVTTDLRYSSDDTLLLRHLNEKNKITVAPQFRCLYHSRSKLNQFIKHSYHRGKVFVDGFLRKGTRFFYPLILFYLTSLALATILILVPKLFIVALVAGVVAWFLELIIALIIGTPTKDAVSLFALSPLFVVAYGAGLWWALVRRCIKKLFGGVE